MDPDVVVDYVGTVSKLAMGLIVRDGNKTRLEMTYALLYCAGISLREQEFTLPDNQQARDCFLPLYSGYNLVDEIKPENNQVIH